MSWVSLCEVNELAEGQGKHVDIDGFQIAVFWSAGKGYAMDNTCPHAGAPMATGHVENGCAICPRHAWAFALGTGELAGSPGVAIRTYPTRVMERDGRPALLQADLPIY
jgi:nitrite reductase (NADH) small subunit